MVWLIHWFIHLFIYWIYGHHSVVIKQYIDQLTEVQNSNVSLWSVDVDPLDVWNALTVPYHVRSYECIVLRWRPRDYCRVDKRSSPYGRWLTRSLRFLYNQHFTHQVMVKKELRSFLPELACIHIQSLKVLAMQRHLPLASSPPPNLGQCPPQLLETQSIAKVLMLPKGLSKLALSYSDFYTVIR